MEWGRRTLTWDQVVAGVQCPRRLWWEVHEPHAEELQPDDGSLLRAEDVAGVRAMVRRLRGEGVSIPYGSDSSGAGFDATREAIDRGAARVYDAAFEFGGVRVRVDLLERDADGWSASLIRASTRVDPERVRELAVVAHVLDGVGCPVNRFRVLHLDGDCRDGLGGGLLAERDVTEPVRRSRRAVRSDLLAQANMLYGLLPPAVPGECRGPAVPCPFEGRCGRVRDRLHDLDGPPSGGPFRLATSVESLDEALSRIAWPRAYVAIDTIRPAIPPWPGCRPFEPTPAQITVTLEREDGRVEHRSWLSSDGGDPRPGVADRLLHYVDDAGGIVVFDEPAVRRELTALGRGAPEANFRLRALALHDLRALLCDHVEQPLAGTVRDAAAAVTLLGGELAGSFPGRDDPSMLRRRTREVLDPAIRPDALRLFRRRALQQHGRVQTLAMVWLCRYLERAIRSGRHRHAVLA